MFLFSKNNRLTTAEQYAKVFNKASKNACSVYTVLSRKNESGEARLGLAIAKKVVKKATKRNLIKRVVREQFRRNKAKLHGLDIVVLCRNKATIADKALLAKQINYHWDALGNDQ